MTTRDTTGKAKGSATTRRPFFKLSDFVLEAILLAIILLLAFTAPGFATWDNWMNILRNAAMTGIIAFGMTFVLILGEIDISVGSGLAFFGCLLAVVTDSLTTAG